MLRAIPPHEKLADYVRTEIARGTFPGAQYAAGEDGHLVLEGAFGFAAVEPERIEVARNTIYDLASLTKPLVTALLAAIFVERGLLDFNSPVSSYLSEFQRINENDWPDQTTVTHLLTHTSGLPAWSPLYLQAESRDEVPPLVARIARRASSPESAQVVYSDLNYILLGFILERITRQRLDSIAQREIFDPLALKRTMFSPAPEFQSEIAATERGREHEQRAVEREWQSGGIGEWESANGYARETVKTHSHNQHTDSSTLSLSYSQSLSFPVSPILPISLPSAPLRGEVHDGNARFLGGVSGHAGLFSTAREVFQITNQFLPGSSLLTSDSLELFTRNFTGGRGDARSIGWMLAETPNCSAGPLLPDCAFGHTGFTGTSIWVDPLKRRAMVLLTNRVHPAVTDVDMKERRQKFNTLAIEAMDAE
jgi:CubicO group peptidase (beta-lactamase class C family)